MLTRLFPFEDSAAKLLRPRIPFALNGAHFMLTRLFFKGSAAFRRFALALCSRYSGTRSALTGFAGSQTGAFLHRTKAIKGTREHTSAFAVKF